MGEEETKRLYPATEFETITRAEREISSAIWGQGGRRKTGSLNCGYKEKKGTALASTSLLQTSREGNRKTTHTAEGKGEATETASPIENKKEMEHGFFLNNKRKKGKELLGGPDADREKNLAQKNCRY